LHPWKRLVLAIVATLSACGGEPAEGGSPESSGALASTPLLVSQAKRHDAGTAPDGATPGVDAAGGTVAHPPPAQCDQRRPGVTAIQVLVRVSHYGGLIHGQNGVHELVDGTVASTIWVYDSRIVDTANVQVAINVASSQDPSGLPHEIPVPPGQTFEVEGEYIPASSANATTPDGRAAVIHYTHSPCGYVVLGGQTYR
jgi:hypothetical protein